MLPLDAWRPHEPRFGFPTFRGVRTLASFSIRPDFTPIDARRLADLAKRAVRTVVKERKVLQGTRELAELAREYAPVVYERARGIAMRFRLILCDREGRYLGTREIPGSYPPGGSIDIDVSEVIAAMGLPDGDYMAVLVMSRGRTDGFRSSPGSYAMTYIGERTYTTYRTGGFARALNDPKRKRHAGFRGINPKAVADRRHLSGLLLINHSSDPAYDETVTPTTVLLRADGATRTASFGPIAPFGGVERSLEELFGEDVVEFLAPFGGLGTTITTCPGVTLASIHTMRARDGSSMSIEHSRPSHTYLANGIG